MNKIDNVKIKSIVCFVLISLTLAVCAAGCKKSDIQQNDYEKKLLGKWAYVHDTKETVAEFKTDGSAKFEGEKYQYSSDEQFISLTDDKEETKKLRYQFDGEGMYVYIQSTYTRQPQIPGDTIVGLWKCEEKGWTFEFSDKGTFMEDGALTGYYAVDEEAGTVKLMYGEALEDTVFYYSLDEDELHIEYPWLMLKR
ncbi:MAG: hypothetical protein PUC30_06875 [Lachnospiraceae bacterium]|nr:hypothetical protein [Lachnospiraceae bacterium]